MMTPGVLSLRGRIGLRGWGITTRAPRRLSNRHRLGQLRPLLREGRRLSRLVHHLSRTCHAFPHQLSCP